MSKKQILLMALLITGLIFIGIGIYSLVQKPEAVQSSLQSVEVKTPQPKADPKAKWFGAIDPKKLWQSTGIKAKRGETIKVSAVGLVVWAHNAGTNNQVGPSGAYYSPADLPLPNPDIHANRFPHNSAKCGSLLMQIGRQIHPVGASATVISQQEGVIEFMVNDRFGALHDNSGNFQVNVEVW
jgi:hypothetical protein